MESQLIKTCLTFNEIQQDLDGIELKLVEIAEKEKNINGLSLAEKFNKCRKDSEKMEKVDKMIDQFENCVLPTYISNNKATYTFLDTTSWETIKNELKNETTKNQVFKCWKTVYSWGFFGKEPHEIATYLQIPFITTLETTGNTSFKLDKDQYLKNIEYLEAMKTELSEGISTTLNTMISNVQDFQQNLIHEKNNLLQKKYGLVEEKERVQHSIAKLQKDLNINTRVDFPAILSLGKSGKSASTTSINGGDEDDIRSEVSSVVAIK